MNQNSVFSTAVLFLLLGTTIPAFAQTGQEEKGGDGGRAQQVQRQQEPQRAQPVQRQQEMQRAHTDANNRGDNGHHYGRIPDDRYRANFGRAHSFRMIRPRMIDGYQRFQYSGYWFGFNDPWPSGWDYNDDVYVDYVGASYYLYNPRHPGIHITLNLF